MKLLFLNQIETCAGWGFETFLNRSLLDIGVTTICIDYQKNAYVLASKLLEINEEFDAVLLERGCGYLIPVEILNAINRPKIFLFTELVARNPQEHYLLRSEIFDRIFFRSIPCMDWIVQQGWLERERMGLFLSAIDPGFHKPNGEIEKDIDILFIGTLLPRRQKIISELSNKFSIATHSAFGQDMVNLVNRAKIILNIHGEDFPDTETRVYETLACKGFLLTERLSPESPFQEGIHLVESKDITDLKEKIAYYLNDRVNREAIAEAGYQEAVSVHTFDARAKQIKEAIEPYLTVSNHSSNLLDRKRLQRCVQWEKIAKVRDDTYLLTRKYLSIIKQSLIKNSRLIYKQ